MLSASENIFTKDGMWVYAVDMDPTPTMAVTAPSIGMLGGGFMARTHTHAARVAGAHLDALASSTPESSQIAARSLGYGRSLSADELTAASLPVVHVCTPNDSHATYSAAAIRAGSFVVCEKPLATSLRDAEELVTLAHESNMVGAVPFVYRYHPMAREARARFHSGSVGRLTTVLGLYLQDWLLKQDQTNWRVNAENGGPSRAFADIGSHLADLIEFVTNDRITRLVAAMRTVHSERGSEQVHTEDAVSVTVEFAGGAVGSLLISQVAPGRKNGLVFEIAGTEASLRFDQEEPELLWVGRPAGSTTLHRDGEQLSAEASRLSFLPPGHPQGYQDAFNAFIADAYMAAAGSPPEGMPTFADGLRAARITEAVLDSARLGTWVDVR